MSSDNTNEDTDDSDTAEASTPSAEASMPSVKKSWFKRPLGVAVLAIVVLAIGAAAFTTLTGQESDDTDSEDQAGQDAADQDGGGGDDQDGDGGEDGQSDSDDQDGEGDAGSSQSAARQTETTTADGEPVPDGTTTTTVPPNTGPTITNGTYFVGTDIPPGTWVSTSTDEDVDCEFGVYANASLSFNSRVRNKEIPVGKSVILLTNQYFQTEDDCGGWQLAERGSFRAEPLTLIPEESFGAFLVGIDIEPGTWISTNTNGDEDCVFHVYEDSSLSDESILRHYRGSPVEKSVTLEESQYFYTGDCGWQLDEQGSSPPLPLTLIPSESAGTFLVGVDISTGPWSNINTDEQCEFAVYKNVSLSENSRIRHQLSGNANESSFTFQKNQYFQTNDKCGGWFLDGQGPTPAEPLTSFSSSGTFLAGVDIAPGIWRSTASRYSYSNCRFSVYRNDSYSDDSLNRHRTGSPSGSRTVDLQANQYFQTVNCGGWELTGQGPSSGNLSTQLGRSSRNASGTYLVGYDISPGKWVRNPVSYNRSDNCQISVYYNASRSPDSRIRHYYGNPEAKSLILHENQYFSTSGCGYWTLDNAGSPPPQPKDTITRTGTFLVGTDIAPGTWTAVSVDTSCQFSVYSDPSILDDSRIRYYSRLEGSMVVKSVTLQSGQYFHIDRTCGGWRLSSQGLPPHDPLTSLPSDDFGHYLVGVDIAAGTWTNTDTDEDTDCHEFSVYGDASLSEDSRILNLSFTNPVGKSITLQENQYFFNTNGFKCGGWQLDDQASPPAEPVNSITSDRSGTLLVGSDILPGTWTNTSTDEDAICEFYVSSDALFADDAIIRYYQGSPVGMNVTLRTNQYFLINNFTNDDCGDWELEDS